MKKKSIVHISACSRQFLEKYFINSDDYALRIFFLEYVGPKLSKHAQVVKIAKGTVYIQAESAVVKNEIMLMKRKILKAMNETLGVKSSGTNTPGELKNITVVQG